MFFASLSKKRYVRCMSYEVTDFEHEVIEESHSRPVLVDFWAPWCGPCRMLGPVLERLAERAGGRWRLVKVNTDEHPELARRYGIMSIPTVKLFVDGRPIAEFVGALSEAQVQQWLEQHLPSPEKEQLQRAKRFIEEGRPDLAKPLLEEAVKSQPNLWSAKLLFAECLLGSDLERASQLCKEIPAAADEFDRARALLDLIEVLKVAKQMHTQADSDHRARLVVEAARAVGELDWEELCCDCWSCSISTETSATMQQSVDAARSSDISVYVIRSLNGTSER